MTHIDLKSTSDAHLARHGGSIQLPCRVNQWELVALAGEGSLARVYGARPSGTAPDRPAAYAVKILRPQWQDDARAQALLRREALVGRSVAHPHVISILSASVSRPPYFVVMPWLRGSTLKTRLAGAKPLEPHVALWIARQVAAGLDGLHRAGWMHGDVKPGNIFLSPEGHAMLLDLGFARRETETGSAVDRCVMGTANYVAPETITSALRADIRSDIYSLGVVLYEMLSGRLPLAGKDLAEIATQHRTAAPPHLAEIAPYLPSDVVELAHQMLAKDPLRRPHTPEELVHRLTAMEIAALAQQYRQ